MARAGRCFCLAACALLVGSQSLQNAIADGDTRTISLHHLHTGENLTVTYKRDGRYDEAALKKINHEMRDWRRDEEVRMDPRVIDVLWEVYRDVGGKEPIDIICGYRAPATNQMLRRRSRGVAQFSQHTLGKAVDFFIPGVPLEQVRIAGLRLQRGGVGFYPTSGSPFVHVDVGGVRHWPRMTHDQLVRVFPNGRTVHIPSDGRPLPGYALALADLQKRGSMPSQMSLDAARNAGIAIGEKPKRSLLAALFGANKDEDEDSETANSPAPSAQAPSQPSPSAPRVRTVAASLVPLPSSRPRLAQPKPAAESSFALASASSEPVQFDASAPAAPAPSAPDVFTARGMWEGPQGRPEPPAPIPNVEPVEVAEAVPSLGPARMRVEPRPSDLDMTGAVAPWPAKAMPDADRVPPDVALAYAAQSDGLMAVPTTRATTPMGASAARNVATEEGIATNVKRAAEDGITTILKRSIPRLVARPAAASAAAAAGAAVPPVTPTKPAIAAGTTYEDPWLRAVVLAPDLQNYLTVTAFEPPDPLQLRALMLKPNSVVMMTFSNDPHLGMSSDRFTGSAVVFVSTVTFTNRTAMLR